MARVRSSSVTPNAAGSAASAPKPAGTASGDLLLAFVVGSGGGITPPAGWTQELVDADYYVYSKVAGGAEPANYAWNSAGSNTMVTTICYTDVPASAQIDVKSIIADGAAGTTHTHTGLTTTVDGTLVTTAWLAGFGGADAFVQSGFRAACISRQTNPNNSFRSIAVFAELAGKAGAMPARATTTTTSVAIRQVQIAIKPAVVTQVKHVKPSGGDYTSLSSWEAGEQADLVTANICKVAECYAMNDTTALGVAGWTTDATRYATIHVPLAERHSGVRDSTKHRMISAGSWFQNFLLVSQAYTRLIGLQVSQPGGGTAAQANANLVAFIDCLFVDSGTGYTNTGGAGTPNILINCAFLNNTNTTGGIVPAGAKSSTFGNGNFYYNCVFVGNGTGGGVDGVSGSLFKNCYSGGNVGGPDYFRAGTPTTSYSADGTGSTPTAPRSLVNFIWIEAGKENLHLDALSSLRGVGTDLTTDAQWIHPYGPADIDSHPRIGAWSVGADGGATVVTKAVKSAGGSYTSLSAWEAGEQADLVALDEIRQAECYAMSDTTAVQIAGWTTDAPHYPRAYVLFSERHRGRRDTSKYVLGPSAPFGGSVTVSQPWARIEGMAITNTYAGTVNSPAGIVVNSGGIARITDCIVYDINNSAANSYGILVTDGTVYLVNCIVMNCLGGRAYSTEFGSTAGFMWAYNCVAANCPNATGFFGRNATTLSLKNCYAGGCATGFANQGSATITQATNYSSDGSLGTTTAAFTAAQFASVTTGSEDLHLVAGSALVGVGTNLAADAQWLEHAGLYVDIEGDEYLTATPDVGAFTYKLVTRVEYASAISNGANVETITFATPTTAGELIPVLVMTALDGTTSVTMTDNLAQTYTKAAEKLSIDGHYIISLWYKENSAAGVTTITVTNAPADTKGGALAAHYKGVATATSLDGNSGTPVKVTGATFASAGITTAQADELVIGGTFTRAGTGASVVVGTGYPRERAQFTTPSNNLDGNNGNTAAMADAVLRATKTGLRYSGWRPGSGDNYPLVVSFKVVAGGGPISVTAPAASTAYSAVATAAEVASAAPAAVTLAAMAAAAEAATLAPATATYGALSTIGGAQVVDVPVAGAVYTALATAAEATAAVVAHALFGAQAAAADSVASPAALGTYGAPAPAARESVVLPPAHAAYQAFGSNALQYGAPAANALYSAAATGAEALQASPAHAAYSAQATAAEGHPVPVAGWQASVAPVRAAVGGQVAAALWLAQAAANAAAAAYTSPATATYQAYGALAFGERLRAPYAGFTELQHAATFTEVAPVATMEEG